jgi:hypothetical protein
MRSDLSMPTRPCIIRSVSVMDMVRVEEVAWGKEVEVGAEEVQPMAYISVSFGRRCKSIGAYTRYDETKASNTHNRAAGAIIYYQHAHQVKQRRSFRIVSCLG